MRELRQLRNIRDSLQRGATISPATIEVALTLAIAVIERLVSRKTRWASVSNTFAVDSDGKIWQRVGDTWELDSVAPVVLS